MKKIIIKDRISSTSREVFCEDRLIDEAINFLKNNLATEMILKDTNSCELVFSKLREKAKERSNMMDCILVDWCEDDEFTRMVSHSDERVSDEDLIIKTILED